MSDILRLDIVDIFDMLPFLSEIDASHIYEDLPKIDIKVVYVVKTNDSTAAVLCKLVIMGL